MVGHIEHEVVVIPESGPRSTTSSKPTSRRTRRRPDGESGSHPRVCTLLSRSTRAATSRNSGGRLEFNAKSARRGATFARPPRSASASSYLALCPSSSLGAGAERRVEPFDRLGIWPRPRWVRPMSVAPEKRCRRRARGHLERGMLSSILPAWRNVIPAPQVLLGVNGSTASTLRRAVFEHAVDVVGLSGFGGGAPNRGRRCGPAAGVPNSPSTILQVHLDAFLRGVSVALPQGTAWGGSPRRRVRQVDGVRAQLE